MIGDLVPLRQQLLQVRGVRRVLQIAADYEERGRNAKAGEELAEQWQRRLRDVVGPLLANVVTIALPHCPQVVYIYVHKGRARSGYAGDEMH